MKKVTILLGLSLLILASVTEAQPVRNGQDVVWARDVEGAEMTLDGSLDEAAWQMAETISLQWGAPNVLPGSGQRLEGEPVLAEPSDGNDGTLYLLRNGNTLWMGLMVNDKSIGGGRGLNAGNWFFDGFIMAMTDRTRRDLINFEGTNNFSTRPAEFVYAWWHPADTLDGGLPIPDIAPRFFGDYGVGFADSMNAERAQERVDVLNWAYTIDGIANDDSHGEDVGYTYEVTIDLGLMGYDFSKEGGDQVPFNFALQDADYQWPLNQDLFFVSRVWFQNQWANNFNEGIGYIYGASDVTLSSGEAPTVTDPEIWVFNAGSEDAPTIDGVMDEAVWDSLDTTWYLQYKAPLEVMDMNPGVVAPYIQRWFRPDFNGDGNAAVVVDPSLSRIKMVHDNDILYLGVDVDDQAISGFTAESGRDGIRFTIRQVDSLNTSFTLPAKQFDVYVDSSGGAALALDALNVTLENPDAVQAAVSLKGSSTVADPSDVDEGYQIEIAINLPLALGYPEGLGDGRLWLSANFFDGDILESMENSYATRTWFSAERNAGASHYAYLSPVFGVSVEDGGAELPQQIALRGNYPNPFNPETTLRYEIPAAADVTLQVYDILGRLVSTVNQGTLPAGTQEVKFNAAGLASGMYLYRFQVTDVAKGDIQTSAFGRMLLLK